MDSPSMAELPTMMKAILQPDKKSHNLTQELVPVPRPTQPDDVLVQVMATCPCKDEMDWPVWVPEMFTGKKTPIPGQDLAGVVVTAPENQKFKPGDEVYARIPATRPGAGAEYTIAKTSELALRPRNLNWAQTAATPISALTAYQALFTQAHLNPAALLPGDGETAAKFYAARAENARLRILIAGASGAVGGWTIQLARAAGVEYVVAVCGAGSVGYVRDLGATEVVIYTEQKLPEWAARGTSRECDVVIDCVGGSTLADCWSVVREGGSLISVCSEPLKAKPAESNGMAKQARGIFFVIDPFGSDLEVVTRLVEAGTCRSLVDSVVNFDDFAHAWKRVEEGHVKGKIVVKVDSRI